MNSLSKLFVFIYNDGEIIVGDISTSTYKVIGGRIIKVKSVNKRIRIQDFYRYNGSSIDTLKMLYPEIPWDHYQDYFKDQT